MDKLKVGLLVDENNHPSYLKDILRLSNKNEFYKIEDIIVQKISIKSNYNLSFFKKIFKFIIRLQFSKLLFGVIVKIESFVFRSLIQINKFDKTEHNNLKKTYVNPIISKSGIFFTFSFEDISQIKKLKLDILIRCGSGILKGDILNSTRFGILSFHHGDNLIYRGGPPGFWEVYYREPSTGFVIQKLNDDLDNGDVIFKGAIPTSPFYILNQYRIKTKATIFMHKILEQIGSSNKFPEIYPKFPFDSTIKKTPGLLQILIYILKTFLILVKKLSRRLFNINWSWGLGYQFIDNWDGASLAKSKKIKNKPGRFYADPFLIFENNKHYCFFEDYDFKKKKAIISAKIITKDSITHLGPVVEESFHLSFPFIFKFRGKYYMCPETNSINEIRLYRCIKFPNKWIYHNTIIDRISASDSIIFFKNNLWWLLTNVDSSDIEDRSSELNIYFNTNPLSKNWISHPMNPIIFDPKRARNGGLIIQGNKFYRVYQKYGFDLYGKAMGISEILIIDKNRYFETNLGIIEPNFFKKIYGTHSFSFNNGLLVFDYLYLKNMRKWYKK